LNPKKNLLSIIIFHYTGWIIKLVRNLYFVACTQQAYDMVHTAGEIFYRVSERSTPL